MTKPEIMAKLDELEVNYDPKSKRDVLEKKLEQKLAKDSVDEIKPEELEDLGTLNGKKIVAQDKQVVNGKVYNRVTTIDECTYLLTDKDIDIQVELGEDSDY